MKHDFSLLHYTQDTVPQFREKQGQNYVDYGSDNKYDLYLRDLYLGSSIHNAICNGVSAMIQGEGLDATDRDASDGKKEQWLRLQKLLQESDRDLLERISMDIKVYGQTYINVIWNRARTGVAQLKHLPVHTMRCGPANSKGEVEVYYHKWDWSKKNEKPLAIQAFNSNDRTEASVCLQIKRYAPSYHYYGLPDYAGSLRYIELDIEVSQFHLANIRNGLFPSMLLSFRNGVPTDDERKTIERQVMEKFSGSNNAGRILITFNDGDETAPTFEAINANNADGMFEYLSSETSRKVLTGHRVSSPLLFGVRGETGFGSNADELRDAYSLFNNTVVVPLQNVLLDGLEPILRANGIDLDIYFKPLKPAEFLDLEVTETQSEAEAEKEGVTMSRVELADWLLNKGESEDELLEGYDLIDSREVNYDHEDTLDGGWTFARTLPGGKTGESEQDRGPVLVRYAYMPKQVDVHAKSRDFCKKMVSNKSKVYKKEDIQSASSMAVNPGWGPGGSDTYDCWLYKGGGNCRHYWERKTFLKKDGPISVNQAKKLLKELDMKLEENDRRVAQRPRDMDNRGFLKPMNWKNPVTW